MGCSGAHMFVYMKSNANARYSGSMFGNNPDHRTGGSRTAAASVNLIVRTYHNS